MGRLRDGIYNVLSISSLGNQYIQANKPWDLLKGSDDDRSVGLGATSGFLTAVYLHRWLMIYDVFTYWHNRLYGTEYGSAASAVRRLPSAVRTATPAFCGRSSGLFCSRPSGLELVTRLPARSVTFLWQFPPWPENFFSRSTSVHSTLEATTLALNSLHSADVLLRKCSLASSA